MIHINNTAGFPSLFISVINISVMWFGEATTVISLSGVSQALYLILMSTWVLAPASALRGKGKTRTSASQQGTEQASDLKGRTMHHTGEAAVQWGNQCEQPRVTSPFVVVFLFCFRDLFLITSLHCLLLRPRNPPFSLMSFGFCFLFQTTRNVNEWLLKATRMSSSFFFQFSAHSFSINTVF